MPDGVHSPVMQADGGIAVVDVDLQSRSADRSRRERRGWRLLIAWRIFRHDVGPQGKVKAPDLYRFSARLPEHDDRNVTGMASMTAHILYKV